MWITNFWSSRLHLLQASMVSDPGLATICLLCKLMKEASATTAVAVSRVLLSYSLLAPWESFI